MKKIRSILVTTAILFGLAFLFHLYFFPLLPLEPQGSLSLFTTWRSKLFANGMTGYIELFLSILIIVVIHKVVRQFIKSILWNLLLTPLIKLWKYWKRPIKRNLAIPAPQLRWPCIFATFSLLLACYWHNHWAPPLTEYVVGFDTINAIRSKLFLSGFIPYVISWVFLFGFFCLLQIGTGVWLFLKWSREIHNERKNQFLKFVQILFGQQKLPNVLQNDAFSKQSYHYERLGELWKYYEEQPNRAITSLKDSIFATDEDDIVLCFVPVTWVEISLPLLGFLGTVVGIGLALYEIREGIQPLLANVNATIDDTTTTYLTNGFKNLALAFDTTFQGLAFLIVIGVLHTIIKKLIAEELAGAKGEISNIISQWPITDPMMPDLSSLEGRVQSLEGAIRDTDNSSRNFRDSVLGMSLRVVREDERLLKIKEVLFKPIVEFSPIGDTLNANVKKELGEKLSNKSWQYVGLATPVGASGIFTVAVKIVNKLYLMTLNMQGKILSEHLCPKQQCKLLASDKLGHAVMCDSQNNIFVAPGNGKPFRNFVHILPFIGNRDTEVVLAIHNNGGTTEIHELKFDDSTEQNSNFLYQLPYDFTWMEYSLCPSSATLWAAGKHKQNQGWCLHRVLLSNLKKDGTAHAGTTSDIQLFGVDIGKLVLFGPGEGIILDESGYLHHWDTLREVPRKLPHNNDWPNTKQCIIKNGANRWIAVVANRNLSMWHLGRDGYLERYHMQFHIDEFVDGSLQVTADGKYLLALVGEQQLVAWEFPQRAIDNL